MADTVQHPTRPVAARSSSTGSSSASPATPATACSSRATASPSASALFGNDLATLPDFPAEIRAPAGTLAGVSAFQVHISDHDITTPGDAPERAGGHEPGRAAGPSCSGSSRAARCIVNTDTFDERNLTKAGYAANPLTDGSLDALHGLRGADDLASPRRPSSRSG